KSEPPAMYAPESRTERQAYAPASRSGPRRSPAHRMSEVQWVGCMLGTTPRRANRGMSAGARICACSTRNGDRGPPAGRGLSGEPLHLVGRYQHQAGVGRIVAIGRVERSPARAERSVEPELDRA